MNRKIKTIKLCVNCHHLHVLGEGQEIEGLEETRFIETCCEMFGHRTKELYQFPVGQGALVLDGYGSTTCPFWESWDLSETVCEQKEIDPATH